MFGRKDKDKEVKENDMPLASGETKETIIPGSETVVQEDGEPTGHGAETEGDNETPTEEKRDMCLECGKEVYISEMNDYSICAACQEGAGDKPEEDESEKNKPEEPVEEVAAPVPGTSKLATANRRMLPRWRRFGNHLRAAKVFNDTRKSVDDIEDGVLLGLYSAYLKDKGYSEEQVKDITKGYFRTDD